jgi:hypothetical protein
MKHSRSEVHCKTRKIPTLHFEDHALTSFSGLVIFQALFTRLGLKERLGRCFGHLAAGSIFGYHLIVLTLVVHLLLGYRRLRESESYEDDPMVKRLLGLSRLPDVATLSRALAQADQRSVEKFRCLVWELVVERLRKLQLKRVTLDFDGSVQSTGRWAEGSAVGFNKKKKGARSYTLFSVPWPRAVRSSIYCTVPAMSTTLTEPRPSCLSVSAACGRPCRG